VQSIPALDLERYAGLWYEVARLPNQFQNRCVAQVTAEYQLLPDGAIRVVNRCQAPNGKPIRAEGRARLAKPGGPASRLKVRFAPAFLSWLSVVWGDYWVLDLTEEYSAALVGTPDRRYLWILSRTPELDPAIYDRMVATAGASGFDLDRLQRTSPY
jgi:apolipoprotein D and lipocalin family protein